MFLQVAEDRDAARAHNAESRCTNRYISRTGRRPCDGCKDVVVSCICRRIPNARCRNALDKLTSLRVDDTELRSVRYVKPIVSAVEPNLITAGNFRNEVDEASIDCIQNIGCAATDREYVLVWSERESVHGATAP